MVEIIVKNPSNEAIEVRNSREPFADHAVIAPGEEKTFTVEDVNNITVARKDVLGKPATQAVTKEEILTESPQTDKVEEALQTDNPNKKKIY